MRMFTLQKERQCALELKECMKTTHDCIDRRLMREDRRIFDHLTLTGMSRLWFTLGQLYSGFGHFFLHGHGWTENNLGDYQESLLN
jgi:hypothetical protein